MKKIVGFALGTNSIEWALVDTKNNSKQSSIVKLSVRVNPLTAIDGKYNFDKEKAIKNPTGYAGLRNLRLIALL